MNAVESEGIKHQITMSLPCEKCINCIVQNAGSHFLEKKKKTLSGLIFIVNAVVTHHFNATSDVRPYVWPNAQCFKGRRLFWRNHHSCTARAQYSVSSHRWVCTVFRSVTTWFWQSDSDCRDLVSILWCFAWCRKINKKRLYNAQGKITKWWRCIVMTNSTHYMWT